MSEDKSERELARWRKKIGMIGIDIKGLHQETETGRLKLQTKLMNERFINELDKIGLQVINIIGTFIGNCSTFISKKSEL
jgi:hypothetical protein